jgi:hypothetical protein
MKTISMVGVGLVIAFTPAFAQTGAKKTCRQESMEACVKRQMSLHDPVSSVAIQRGDAERFCGRRAQRC